MRDVHAFALLLIVLGCFFWRPLFLGEVVFPHDNDLELGIAAAPEPDRPVNRKFSDESSQYVPELHHHLNGNASRWISTWNPHVELGRPTSHVAATSKAFWPTHVLSWLSNDAFRVYTLLSLFATSGAACFALLLLRAEGLEPPAALAGALGIGLGVFNSYWATYALFVFGIAWTLAWLWLIRRLLAAWDPLSFVGVVVVVQALLLSAYPQQIVWHVWFVAIYTLHAATRCEGGLPSRWRALALIGAASLLGVVAAAPVYLDLAVDAARSARIETPVEFFQSVLPTVGSAADALAQATQIVDAWLFGDPIDPYRPLAFDGISLTPLYVFGMLASFLDRGFRRLWPIQIFVGFALLATFAPSVHAFGIRYLGLSLSRFVPLAGAMIPIGILAAHGFDAVLRDPARRLWPSGTLALGLIGLSIATHSVVATPLVASRVGVTLAVAGLVIVFALRRSRSILVGVAVASVFLYAHPLLLLRSPDAIHRTSPLVDRLQSLTQDGSRFAWIGRNVIPPNQEALIGLRSIHTYDSLSSRAYQRWTREISARGATTHGRYFPAIRGVAQTSPWLLQQAGVGALVSPTRLDPSLARPVSRSSGVWLHRPLRPPAFAGQSTRWRALDAGHVEIEEVALEASLAVNVDPIADDRTVVEVTRVGAPTLLWVGRQYHPGWIARSEGEGLETVTVDGVYLGVLVPAGVTRIELGFEPAVRWAWIPQLCLLVALVACIVWRSRRARAAS